MWSIVGAFLVIWVFLNLFNAWWYSDPAVPAPSSLPAARKREGRYPRSAPAFKRHRKAHRRRKGMTASDGLIVLGLLGLCAVWIALLIRKISG